MIKLFLLAAMLLFCSCQYSDSAKRDLACLHSKCPAGMVAVDYDVDGCGCQVKIN